MKITTQEFLEIENPILQDFKRNFLDFKLEAEKIYNNDLLLEWLSKQIYNQGWKVLGFRYEGQTLINQIIKENCPKLYDLFIKYEKYIYSIAYSSLEPGTEIYPHFDRKKPHNVLRCHLGLIIPNGDCKLRVNDIDRTWKEGEFLIFDDSFIHQAWNRTESKRIVLLIDFNKSMLID